MMDRQEEVISTGQAAEMLDVSIPTVRDLVDKGMLSGFQLTPGVAGSPWRVTLASVHALLEKRRLQMENK